MRNCTAYANETNIVKKDSPILHVTCKLCKTLYLSSLVKQLIPTHFVVDCNVQFFQCKEWGFLLLEMFGTSLGTGDYGHLTVEHVPMLFRMHRSLHHLSNQGYEAGHKLQRLLYLRATSHDSSSSTSSGKLRFQSKFSHK